MGVVAVAADPSPVPSAAARLVRAAVLSPWRGSTRGTQSGARTADRSGEPPGQPVASYRRALRLVTRGRAITSAATPLPRRSDLLRRTLQGGGASSAPTATQLD